MPIHPTAIVEDGAEIGAGVEIGPFCFVESGVKLADGVRLMSHVVVHGGTQIGARTVVHPQAVIGGEGQIRKGDPTGTRLVVGEDCVLRECVTLSRGSKKGGGITTIGDRCYIMAYSHFGHDCHVGNDVTVANAAAVGGHVTIGDGVIIGGIAAIQQFGRVGKYAFVGGVTGINEDLIPYGMAFGDHAQLAGLNLIGLKRRGVPRANIHALRAAYRAIFLNEEGSIGDRAKRAGENWGEFPEVQDVVSFILADFKQAICTARRRGSKTDEV